MTEWPSGWGFYWGEWLGLALGSALLAVLAMDSAPVVGIALFAFAAFAAVVALIRFVKWVWVDQEGWQEHHTPPSNRVIRKKYKTEIATIRKLWELYRRDPKASDPELGTWLRHGSELVYVPANMFRGHSPAYFSFVISQGPDADQFIFWPRATDAKTAHIILGKIRAEVAKGNWDIILEKKLPPTLAHFLEKDFLPYDGTSDPARIEYAVGNTFDFATVALRGSDRDLMLQIWDDWKHRGLLQDAMRRAEELRKRGNECTDDALPF